MGQPRYIVGIDLGTTNCAMAYVDLADPAEQPPVRLFNALQLIEPGTVAELPGLPSFLYLPGAHDLRPGDIALPWAPRRSYAVGAFARDQGGLVPSRLIASAKSWLCHAGVDREAAILPWGSPSDVPHLSPVAASARYLEHLREAWDQKMSAGRAEWVLAQSDVVLTVPASFDEVARELTVRAARMVGLERLTLLEEPQAAFYSWVRAQGNDWQEQVHDGELVLVCDVGGGTTDFSLIAVRGSGQQTTLERVAVGDHLMLGGDNMDLALARHLEHRLVKRAGELSPRQWGALVHSCRRAKEELLSAKGDERFKIIVAGSGSKVIGGGLSIDLFRDEVEAIVLDGFFPRTSFDAPLARPRLGLQELGLPYANDPAVTKNLAAFLKRHNARPDAILFNGGAMKASLAQDRVVEVLGSWFGSEPEVLESTSLDLAVALGAATYGLVRAGMGVRIRGGTARAYYVGVSSAEPGSERRAVCLIPFGVDEGDQVAIDDRIFDLLTDRPVSFPLYASTAPLGHDPGDVVSVSDDVFTDLPPIHTVLSHNRGLSHQTVPVRLGARLTELGTLELWCASVASKARWDLEFSLRKEQPPAADALPAAAPIGDSALEVSDAEVSGAKDLILESLATLRPQSPDLGPRALTKRLEELFRAERMQWPGSLVRNLWSALTQGQEGRRLSAEHEAAWLNLAGILLRPGFGDPLDPQRVEEVWRAWRAGLCFEDNLWCRLAWWVLWRRVSGGLDKGQQLELSNRLAPPLLSGAALKAAGAAGKGGAKKKVQKGKKRERNDQASGNGASFNRQELAEMWRTVASLERIPAISKEGLGDVALRNAVAARGDFVYWALGRLGARVPLYGSVADVIARAKVEGWIDRLLGLDWSKHRGIALALVHISRLCGAEDRDIDPRLRRAVLDRLREHGCSEQLIRLVTEVTVLQEQEKAQLFGDALPTGLRLSEARADGRGGKTGA
jgi:molecular chaperone DnaK (HSP70)